MQFHLPPLDRDPARGGADTILERPRFGPDRGCRTFVQRVLRAGAGRSAERRGADDELLYVLDGAGALSVDGERFPVHAGNAVYVAAGTPWASEVEDGGALELLSVVVCGAAGEEVPYAVLDLGAEDAQRATAGREFRLGLTAETGCRAATQFIGHIPPGRAPDHFHRYDEVVYVLTGEGTLHIGGETAALVAGACVHLPARVVHSLENAGPDELLVLGVFRPAGSPAEAYYPDGTPALVPVET